MAQWQTTDAQNRFADLVAAADGHGPQAVMLGKDVSAVVLSPEEYRRLVRQADANFNDLLAQSPFRDVEPIGISLSSGA